MIWNSSNGVAIIFCLELTEKKEVYLLSNIFFKGLLTVQRATTCLCSLFFLYVHKTGFCHFSFCCSFAVAFPGQCKAGDGVYM